MIMDLITKFLILVQGCLPNLFFGELEKPYPKTCWIPCNFPPDLASSNGVVGKEGGIETPTDEETMVFQAIVVNFIYILNPHLLVLLSY